jgi:periplasmic protein TonB
VKLNSKNTDQDNGAGHQPYEISDFDDLVFEHRNREYGAYDIRKRYNRALLAGTIVASLIIIISVVIPFVSRPSAERVVSGGDGFYQVRMENLQPPKELIYIPPAPPPPEAAKMHQTVEYVPPVVVDSIVPTEQTMVSTDEVLASAEGDIVDASGSGFGDDLLPGGDGTGSDEPLFIVETMPTFKGGDLTEFRNWVGKRTRYPEAAIINKIRGTVFLTFIVEKDGSVSNVTVVKGVHPLLDEEAVRAISDSPKWSPGLQRGLPVRVRFQIPLDFRY